MARRFNLLKNRDVSTILKYSRGWPEMIDQGKEGKHFFRTASSSSVKFY